MGAIVKAMGVVRADEVYPRDEFMRRVGLAKHAYAAAMRNGLKVKRVGNRAYVTGADWLEFLNSRPAYKPPAPTAKS